MKELLQNPGAMMIAAVGLQYAVAMVFFMGKMHIWDAVTYLGYAIGNVGLTMRALGHP
jgi:hypothetical protein